MGQHLLESGGARARRLFLSPFAVTVRMLGVASLADDLRNLQLNHASDGVVQEQAAAWAIIVDQVTQTFLVLAHRSSFGQPLQSLSPRARIITVRGAKATAGYRRTIL